MRKRLFRHSPRPGFKNALAAVLIALVSSAFAAAPSNFEEGNALYANGKFKEAKQAYEAVVATGNYSANLFYNLANTEFRLGEPGLAALNYERALLLAPAHAEARANLSVVRTQTGAKVTPRSWQDFFFVELSPNTYALVASVAGWACLFCLVAAVFRKSRQGMVTAAVLCLLAAGYAFFAIRFLNRYDSFAIVTAKRSDARFAPMENSTLAETLPAGSHVRILTLSGAWAYCDLPNGNRAWLPKETIQSLKPTEADPPSATGLSGASQGTGSPLHLPQSGGVQKAT